MKKSETITIQKINLYWIIAGLAIALLLTISTVSSSWQRMNPEHRQNISVILYSLSVAFSYFIWIVVVLLINRLIGKIPMFAEKHKNWWLIHGVISIGNGCILLFIDTVLLWSILSQTFGLLAAYYEKMLRWLPYEILAYWAALGILTAVLNAKISQHTKKTSYLSRLSINNDEEKIIINVADIEQIKAYDNYNIICNDEKQYLLNDTMHHLETSLDPKDFLRVHRSSIINLNKINSLVNDEKGQLIVNLHNGDKVTVSRRKTAKLNAQFKVQHKFK